jgi:Putative adhesin
MKMTEGNLLKFKTIKVLASTAATLALAATTAFAADSNFDRTLNVSGSPNVSVATGSGYIHLNPGSGNQVHIVAHVRSSHGWMSGGSDVDSRIQQIVNNPPIVQNGNDIIIGPEHHNGDLYRNINIDYEITLPKTSGINATTGSGDVQIQDVGASVKAQSGSGSVHVHGVQGPTTLGTGSGDIELLQTGPGDVKAETGSGSIRLQGLAGALKASTGSGDIEAQGQPTADWKLSTGSGSVRLAVGNAKFNLDADTGSGSINVSQPITMQGSLNRHHVSGVVNGGGPTIRVGTGSGDIQIK